MSDNINTPDLSNAKIGDKLWHSLTGKWETIKAIHGVRSYPIRLTNELSCTFDGKGVKDEPPSFFWQSFKIPQECLTRPEDPLPPNGTLCWGKQYTVSSKEQPWIVGYLYYINEELWLFRDPLRTSSLGIQVTEITTENPYAKERNNEQN